MTSQGYDSGILVVRRSWLATFSPLLSTLLQGASELQAFCQWFSYPKNVVERQARAWTLVTRVYISLRKEKCPHALIFLVNTEFHKGDIGSTAAGELNKIIR